MILEPVTITIIIIIIKNECHSNIIVENLLAVTQAKKLHTQLETTHHAIMHGHLIPLPLVQDIRTDTVETIASTVHSLRRPPMSIACGGIKIYKCF